MRTAITARGLPVIKAEVPQGAWGIGLLLLAVSGVLFAVGLPIEGAVAAGAALIFAALGALRRVPRECRLLPQWDQQVITDAFRTAPAHSRVRILETWIPEVETLRGRLIDTLADDGKHFSLQVLLMNPGPPVEPKNGDLLGCRVLLRQETRAQARRLIIESVRELFDRKHAAEAAWAREAPHHQRSVDLSIRVYNFLPFGPIYEINDRLYVGLYPNYEASEEGPMLVVEKSAALWKVLESHFDAGWDSSRDVLAYDEQNDTLQLARSAATA
jgi:hypothetical protein